VISFLNSITNPKDRIGLAYYNTYYNSLSHLTNNKSEIERYLEGIDMPKELDAFYSEIYGSVLLAAKEFKDIKGRKAIIILSDGENASLFEKTGKPHRVFKEKIVDYAEPLKQLQMAGISLYVINFGREEDKKDKLLIDMAEQSGGFTLDAHDSKELKQVYFYIMNQIVKEYQLTYQATMSAADKKYVKVVYTGKTDRTTATRFYFASTVFGQPMQQFKPELIAVFIAACFMLWLISMIRFEKQRKKASLEILNRGDGAVSTQILTLNNNQTKIGSGPDANMTIAGISSIQDNHATIIFNKTENQYELIGNGKLSVNNKVVVSKVLESGDLINIDGVTMVFDEGKAGNK